MQDITALKVTDLMRILRKATRRPARRQTQDSSRETSEAAELPLPAIKTAERLMAEAGCLPPMLVEQLLPDGSLFLLTGKPKAGKSFLALDIADSVSRGTPALGALAVNRPGPVLYLAMEDGPIELSRRLSQRRFEPGQHTLYFIDEPFSLTDPRNFARIRQQAIELKPSLLVIDTAAEALDIRDWISRSEILTKIAPLRGLAREICTVLLVAHNRKAEGDMGDEIAGSNALAGAVDGWISAHKVERRPNGNRRLFLRIEGRGGVGHELATEMDHATLRFSIIPAEQVEEEAVRVRENVYTSRRGERLALARKALHNLGGRATIAELAAAMSVSYGVAWSLIRELTASGETEEISPADGEGAGRRSPRYHLRSSERKFFLDFNPQKRRILPR